MLPDSQDKPTTTTKHDVHSSVSTAICIKLCLPELAIVDWYVRVLWAAVPETAVYEDCEPLFAEDKVWFAEDGLIPSPARDAVPSHDGD